MYVREPVTSAPSVGLGFRPEFASELVDQPGLVDFVEIVAETAFTQRARRREAIALAELWPIVPHGVKLSLGSAGGVDLDRARRLGALAAELRAPVIAEHVSFTRAGDVDIGHLTQLPRTRAAVAVVARNVAAVRRVLPDVPLLLENVAWSLRWPDDEMDEATFYQEIVAATGCDLLLDVGNLYANAINEGKDPSAVLAAYPIERVAMVHVAGGVREHGFYFDTHAHAIPGDVFTLCAELAARRPEAPMLIERDASFDFAEVRCELAALRALPRGPGTAATAVRPAASAPRTLGDAAVARLAAAQRELAGQLARGEHLTALSERIGRVAIERTRAILARKRVDDALPLLGNLARHGDRVREIADGALAATRRAPSAAGPTDAWTIAQAALGAGELASAAAIDLLVLRARFSQGGEALRPRRGPFVGRVRLPDGRTIRATKGLGARAQVTLVERKDVAT